jgi:DNA-directed RNA polymerase subunit M/transcription elongation factor TFIIS
MFWLTERKPNHWYIMVTCLECKSRTILFADETNGRDEHHLTYFFSCPNCHHQQNHDTERYWNSAAENVWSES